MNGCVGIRTLDVHLTLESIMPQYTQALDNAEWPVTLVVLLHDVT